MISSPGRSYPKLKKVTYAHGPLLPQTLLILTRVNDAQTQISHILFMSFYLHLDY